MRLYSCFACHVHLKNNDCTINNSVHSRIVSDSIRLKFAPYLRKEIIYIVFILVHKLLDTNSLTICSLKTNLNGDNSVFLQVRHNDKTCIF
jgi:hypothetical protein